MAGSTSSTDRPGAALDLNSLLIIAEQACAARKPLKIPRTDAEKAALLEWCRTFDPATCRDLVKRAIVAEGGGNE